VVSDEVHGTAANKRQVRDGRACVRVVVRLDRCFIELSLTCGHDDVAAMMSSPLLAVADVLRRGHEVTSDRRSISRPRPTSMTRRDHAERHKHRNLLPPLPCRCGTSLGL